MTARQAVPVLAVASALVLAGCGSLDTGKAQDELVKIIKSQVGVTVKSVDCPKDVKPKAGDVFTCTATAQDGTKAVITVTQKDDKGNVGISAPLLHISGLEQTLASKIGGGLTVDCPDLVTVKQGDSFSCDARTAAGATSKIKVTFVDAKGNVRYQVEGSG